MPGMRLPRPKSLSSLMLTGFALVSVPLLLAVVIAATKVRALSEESAALVRSGVETAHLTQQLFQQIASIERSAKLYQVLNDPGLIEVYRDSRERFLVTVNNIETVAADSVHQAQLQLLRQSLRRVDGGLLARPPVPPELVRDAVEAIAPMWEAAFELSASTGERIETGLSRLQTSTAETQQYLFWQSAALILLTALLVTVFTFLLMRPIRQIDSAISQLGKGTFSKPIAVRGPTDLVNLGRQLEWLRVRLLDVKAGALSLPEFVMDPWVKPWIERARGPRAAALSGSDPLRASLANVKSISDVFEPGVVLQNRFVWPNGERRFRIGAVIIQPGMVRVRIEPF